MKISVCVRECESGEKKSYHVGEEIDEVVECVVAMSRCKGQLQRVQVYVGAKAAITVLRLGSHHVHPAAPQSQLFFVSIQRAKGKRESCVTSAKDVKLCLRNSEWSVGMSKGKHCLCSSGQLQDEFQLFLDIDWKA